MSYRMMGGDAMLHFWAHGEERKKGSIALYAKAGLNHMTNNANGVKYEQSNNFQLFGGLGAELYLQRRFSVRLELESYDTDAALLSLNLIKRFGFKSKARAKSVILPQVEPQTLVIVPVVVDSDLDGLLDDEDQCPYTPRDLTVDDRGCAAFDGKLGDLIANIQFEVNSASLTETSKTALSEIVNMLKSYPAVKIDVQAHSDNTGSARYNKKLSQKRAESVVDYLRQKNITGSRLTAEGFGEEKPIADNNTKYGRAKNRRVEFVLTHR
jgi:outer membrane protein OmpA-like peptidoglycan-associated protein